MRWQDGYPCDTGSTDGQDSARLAGLMYLFKHPDYRKFELNDYCGFGDYLRHPIEHNIYPFSRDQATCLFAGLSISDRLCVNQDYNPTNKDWISPSVRGHFIRCSGEQAKWYHDLWLLFDVIWSAKVDPMAEPNQLISMLMVHPSKRYLWLWTKLNKRWDDSIIEYWSKWRQEHDLAQLIAFRIIKEISVYETRKETN
jgi:hypothetical protein